MRWWIKWGRIGAVGIGTGTIKLPKCGVIFSKSPLKQKLKQCLEFLFWENENMIYFCMPRIARVDVETKFIIY